MSTEKRRFLLVCRPAQTQWFVICPYPQNPLYALWSYAIYANIPSKSIICILYITQDFPRSPSIICGSPMLIILVKKIYPTARAVPRIDIWAQGKYSMEICHMPEQRPHWGFVRGEYMDFLSILQLKCDILRLVFVVILVYVIVFLWWYWCRAAGCSEAQPSIMVAHMKEIDTYMKEQIFLSK